MNVAEPKAILTYGLKPTIDVMALTAALTTKTDQRRARRLAWAEFASFVMPPKLSTAGRRADPATTHFPGTACCTTDPAACGLSRTSGKRSNFPNKEFP
ncbi:hypothetical protein [Amycolatopsis japonica]